MVPLYLQKVRAIHTRARDLNQDLSGTRVGHEQLFEIQFWARRGSFDGDRQHRLGGVP